ncbi:MAG: hypothetical protein EAZ58_10815, partial [Flavobacterium sp.]
RKKKKNNRKKALLRTIKRAFFMIRSGQHWAFLLASSRDSLYLCCRTPATKDAASPGARKNYFAFLGTSKY